MTPKEKQAYAKNLLLHTKCAVLIVDVQNDYCHEIGACAKSGKDVNAVDSIIEPIQKLAELAKKNAVPVIYIKTIHEKITDSEVWCRRMNGNTNDICRRNTWGSEFYKLIPKEQDIIVEKHRYSAFIGTKLSIVLRSLKIETLLISGVATNVCVESTARDGYMLDYNIFLFEDCCAAFDKKEHKMSLQNVDSYFGMVTTVEFLEKLYEEHSHVVLKSYNTHHTRKKVEIK